ncbi:MAG: secretin N-terminal domain-containing protein [Solidesulfovibrio sp.]
MTRCNIVPATTLCFVILFALLSVPPCLAAKATPEEGERVELNFREADVLAVLQFYSEILGKTFIPSDELTGKVTVIASSPMTRNEAKKLLFSILDVKGFSVVEMDNAYKVVKKKDAVQSAGANAKASSGSDQIFTELFFFKNVAAKNIVEDLRKVLSPEASLFAGSDGNYLVASDKETNLNKLRGIIAKIDNVSFAQVTTSYRLQYLKAEVMAKTLGDIFKQEGQEGRSGNLQILPVKDSNTLVVTALPAMQARVTKIISEMDKRTPQVSISAMLVEVILDESSKMGLDWKLRSWSNNNVFNEFAQDTIGNVLTTGSQSAATNMAKYADASTKAAMYFNIFPGGYLSMLVHMISSDTNAKILSAPHLLVADNQEASITLGKEIPILQEYRLDTNNQPIRTYSQRTFGLDLKITPSIADNSDVTLKVSQKLSNLDSTDTLTQTYEASERTADTTVLVHDHQTLVIGGLMMQNSEDTDSGTPSARKIPVLGYLFGTKTKSKQKRELLLFITPTVVRDPIQADAMSKEYKEDKPYLVDQAGLEFDL